MKMLNVNKLNVYYGNVQALWDITLVVNEREIVTLIGANGAGKTTFMMTLSGILRPKSGKIEYLGSRIDGLKPHYIISMGIAQVPQGRHLFPEMTVKENLELGAYRLRTKRFINERLETIYGLFPILRDKENQKAGSLSGGQQQMLAFGRALMSKSKLLLLDEPSAGLAPIMVKELARIIRNLREKKEMTILIVEQNAILALDLADRGYVLESGNMVASGKTSDLSKSELVKKAYLGM
ncbi:MAG: ABC transporter ATP-binding protein [Deltaproteobacteria bacterium]|nr:ABC transporter ATP-binding protein [Deltaproteobacteria bacterium]